MYYVLLAILLWSTIGLLACTGFRREGHNFWLYAGLGTWMGPFILRVMRLVARDQENSVVQELEAGAPRDGWLDLLVGIDGTQESSASVSAAIRTLRPALRSQRCWAQQSSGSPTTRRFHFSWDRLLTR